MTKITIIGAGSVGSTIAYTLTTTGMANEIVLIDINHERAIGEALDIEQSTPYSHPCTIYAGNYEDAKDSNIVILTSGVARKPGQSRLDLAQTNVNITKRIIPDIVRYAPDAFYVIVSNPVDILTYTFCKRAGIPENRIIGSGTSIDTSRLRAYLAGQYRINQNNVHAYVFGEHGDSSFVPWSVTNISNVPIAEYGSHVKNDHGSLPLLDYAAAEKFVHESGAMVIERKGATYYAIAVAACHICKRLLGSIDATLTVSTMLHGEYGIDDVCMSILSMVGNNGISNKLLISLTDEEIIKLRHSADSLKSVINQLDI